MEAAISIVYSSRQLPNDARFQTDGYFSQVILLLVLW